MDLKLINKKYVSSSIVDITGGGGGVTYVSVKVTLGSNVKSATLYATQNDEEGTVDNITTFTASGTYTFTGWTASIFNSDYWNIYLSDMVFDSGYKESSSSVTYKVTNSSTTSYSLSVVAEKKPWTLTIIGAQGIGYNSLGYSTDGGSTWTSVRSDEGVTLSNLSGDTSVQLRREDLDIGYKSLDDIGSPYSWLSSLLQEVKLAEWPATPVSHTISGSAATGTTINGTGTKAYNASISGTINVNTGYNLNSWKIVGNTSGTTYNSGTGTAWSITMPDEDVTIYTYASVKSYTLSVTKNTGINIVSVVKTSSPYAGVDIGTSLSNGATIYYGDVLSITVSALSGFTVNSSSYSSSVTATGNVTVSPTTTANSYTLTKIVGSYLKTNSISIYRTSSPYKGAATGELTFDNNNEATVYCGDIIKVSYSPTDTPSYPYSSISNPTYTIDYGTKLHITNSNEFAPILYYKNSSESSYTQTTIMASSTLDLVGVSGVTYSIYYEFTETRYEYSATATYNSTTITSGNTFTVGATDGTIDIEGTRTTGSLTLKSNTVTTSKTASTISSPVVTNIAEWNRDYNDGTYNYTLKITNNNSYAVEVSAYVNSSSTKTNTINANSTISFLWNSEGTSPTFTGHVTFTAGSLSASTTSENWAATVNLGVGVSKYSYSTDNGVTWNNNINPATSGYSVPCTSTGDTVIFKNYDVNEGYEIVTNTNKTASYYDQSVTTDDATRITWSAIIKKGNNLASWKYKIDKGSWITCTDSSKTISNIDYSSTLYVIEVSADEGYTVNATQKSLTYSDTSSKSVTYTLNASTLNTYILSFVASDATISVSRTNSPIGGGATGKLNTGDTIYYNDVLNISLTAKTPGSWDRSSVTVPTYELSGTVYKITNIDTKPVTIYGAKSSSFVLNSNSSEIIDGEASTTYSIYAECAKNRTVYSATLYINDVSSGGTGYPESSSSSATTLTTSTTVKGNTTISDKAYSMAQAQNIQSDILTVRTVASLVKPIINGWSIIGTGDVAYTIEASIENTNAYAVGLILYTNAATSSVYTIEANSRDIFTFNNATQALDATLYAKFVNILDNNVTSDVASSQKLKATISLDTSTTHVLSVNYNNTQLYNDSVLGPFDIGDSVTLKAYSAESGYDMPTGSISYTITEENQVLIFDKIATRITWQAIVNMGIGVSQWAYSLDNGDTWISKTTNDTITLDYADVIQIKNTVAQTGFTLVEGLVSYSYNSSWTPATRKQTVTTVDQNLNEYQLIIDMGGQWSYKGADRESTYELGAKAIRTESLDTKQSPLGEVSLKYKSGNYYFPMHYGDKFRLLTVDAYDKWSKEGTPVAPSIELYKVTYIKATNNNSYLSRLYLSDENGNIIDETSWRVAESGDYVIFRQEPDGSNLTQGDKYTIVSKDINQRYYAIISGKTINETTALSNLDTTITYNNSTLSPAFDRDEQGYCYWSTSKSESEVLNYYCEGNITISFTQTVGLSNIYKTSAISDVITIGTLAGDDIVSSSAELTVYANKAMSASASVTTKENLDIEILDSSDVLTQTDVELEEVSVLTMDSPLTVKSKALRVRLNKAYVTDIEDIIEKTENSPTNIFIDNKELSTLIDSNLSIDSEEFVNNYGTSFTSYKINTPEKDFKVFTADKCWWNDSDEAIYTLPINYNDKPIRLIRKGYAIPPLEVDDWYYWNDGERRDIGSSDTPWKSLWLNDPENYTKVVWNQFDNRKSYCNLVAVLEGITQQNRRDHWTISELRKCWYNTATLTWKDDGLYYNDKLCSSFPYVYLLGTGAGGRGGWDNDRAGASNQTNWQGAGGGAGGMVELILDMSKLGTITLTADAANSYYPMDEMTTSDIKDTTLIWNNKPIIALGRGQRGTVSYSTTYTQSKPGAGGINIIEIPDAIKNYIKVIVDINGNDGGPVSTVGATSTTYIPDPMYLKRAPATEEDQLGFKKVKISDYTTFDSYWYGCYADISFFDLASSSSKSKVMAGCGAPSLFSILYLSPSTTIPDRYTYFGYGYGGNGQNIFWEGTNYSTYGGPGCWMIFLPSNIPLID